LLSGGDALAFRDDAELYKADTLSPWQERLTRQIKMLRQLAWNAQAGVGSDA
jgi:hypothetical protein